MTAPTPGRWPADRLSPYVHWRGVLGGVPAGGAVVERALDPDRELAPALDPSSIGAGDPAALAEAVAPMFGDGSAVPIPRAVANPDPGPLQRLLPGNIAALIPQAPPRDAVITGIIDEAIALGHPRFRLPDGRTRILAAWQQGAGFDPAQRGYLPFGHELYQSGIDALIRRHSAGGDPRRDLDETGFMRAARLSEPLVPHGVRALEQRLGHGTAVLDLAAGEDPWRADPARLARRPILAATLPRRYTVGMAGAFLEYFTIYAMHRMVALADALWQAHHGGPGGWPIVLNLSYGQQAGPKDGRSLFERAVERLRAARAPRAPLQVVMPVGNDNLERCNARRNLGDGGYFRQELRVQPDDASSNFVEVWTGRVSGPAGANPLEIAVAPPGGALPAPWRGADGEYLDLAGGARIYCQRVAYPNGAEVPGYRHRYVICTPPTAPEVRAHGLARHGPAGLWRIEVRNRGATTEVHMNVQVDQSAEPARHLNRRAYFESPRYRTHLDNGRRCDSYAYPVPPDDPAGAHLEAWSRFGPIQRKGTVNALAVSPAIAVIGGHRARDGRPADYSATAFWRNRGPRAASLVSASLPSDDGALHPGRLAAGTQAGAVVTPRGTSYAAARATRMMVAALLDADAAQRRASPAPGSPEWLQQRAAESEARLETRHGAAHELKRGHGRIDDPQRDRAVPRF